MKQNKRNNTKIIFVFLILIVSFAYCGQYEGPTNERAHCKVLIYRNQTDMDSCGNYLIMYRGTTTTTNSNNSTIPANTPDSTYQCSTIKMSDCNSKRKKV